MIRRNDDPESSDFESLTVIQSFALRMLVGMQAAEFPNDNKQEFGIP